MPKSAPSVKFPHRSLPILLKDPALFTVVIFFSFLFGHLQHKGCREESQREVCQSLLEQKPRKC